jgi:hypothetical protein
VIEINLNVVYNKFKKSLWSRQIMLKINQILLNWNDGHVHGLEWLDKYGVDRKLAHKYCKSGYIERLASGVYVKAHEVPDAYAVIKFLQEEVKLRVHVSGKTALEMHGHSHYLNMGKKAKIFLTSYESRNVPKWLMKFWEHFEVSFRKSSLLKSEKFITKIASTDSIKVLAASRELAILELIESLDLSNSLETVEKYAESLHTLRVDLLQEVLEECRSVKVKRVFLYLSEKLNLPFFKKLTLDKIDLGRGKRVVVKGGALDTKYNITVDRKLEENPF